MDRNIQEASWLDPRVEVRSSAIHGQGLFARAPIRADETVVRLGGRVLTDDELLGLGLDEHNSLAIGDHLNLLLDDKSPVVLGNHSCDANLWMVDEVTFAARRDIAPGEEVTDDYALFGADLPFRMECRCGSAACRGLVTNDDWRRPDLQERYAGHFSPFLNGRIAAMNHGTLQDQ